MTRQKHSNPLRDPGLPGRFARLLTKYMILRRVSHETLRDKLNDLAGRGSGSLTSIRRYKDGSGGAPGTRIIGIYQQALEIPESEIDLLINPQEGSVWHSGEHDFVRKWLCDCLGFSASTVLVYSDGLGKDLTETDPIVVIGTSPQKQPTRSRRFADLIRELFERTTSQEMDWPLGFGSLRDEDRKELLGKPNLALLGSEISNSLYRRMFRDVKAPRRDARSPGSMVNMFEHPSGHWYAQLPVTLVTHTDHKDNSKRVIEGPWLPEDRQHEELWRGYKHDDWTQVVFPAEAPNFSFDPLGDFVITKLLSPATITPQQKIISINGIHGRGAIAARQLFEFTERPGDMKTEIALISEIMERVEKIDSWQVVVRASAHDMQTKKRFTKLKIVAFGRVFVLPTSETSKGL